MGVEYELKYRATEAILDVLAQYLPQAGNVMQMETTYYDTPSGQLSGKKYTLRKRMENGRAVCTLKAPISGIGRGEWEIPCDSIESAIPELCKLGCPADLELLVQEGLSPICGAKFTRIARTVTQGGCAVEIALDRGILTGGGRESPLCEVEVELKSGTPEQAAAYAQALAARFHLEPEPKSKFRRALALYRGE